MNTQEKEKLIVEWKKLRGNFFNLYKEDITKFEKHYIKHPLYSSVIKHFDKSFTEVNQLAQQEIDTFIKQNQKH